MSYNVCVQPSSEKLALAISGGTWLICHEPLHLAARLRYGAAGRCCPGVLAGGAAFGRVQAPALPLELYTEPSSPAPPSSVGCTSVSQLMVPEEWKSKPRLSLQRWFPQAEGPRPEDAVEGKAEQNHLGF